MPNLQIVFTLIAISILFGSYVVTVKFRQFIALPYESLLHLFGMSCMKSSLSNYITAIYWLIISLHILED